ncbi:MAG: hypothetical protein NBV65_09780 [Burkholderiaceae bacterium]|nr:hypothetical protein [Burkholderiaceae bacterium]
MKLNLRRLTREFRRARMTHSASCSQAVATRSCRQAQRVRLLAGRGGAGKNHIVVDRGDWRERQTVVRHLLPTSPACVGGLARLILDFQVLGSNTPLHGPIATSVRP